MKTKILYDGNCVVCDMEISHYKRVAPDLFELVDISAPEFDAQKFNLSRAAVEKDLHVLTPEGKLQVGVDAFAHIWSVIKKYNILATFIKLPGIYSVAKVGYEIFTRVRPYLPKKRPVN
jgi:predicted DCC family thiol-disulfide oxidoreductase YuxK